MCRGCGAEKKKKILSVILYDTDILIRYDVMRYRMVRSQMEGRREEEKAKGGKGRGKGGVFLFSFVRYYL